jgi:hypothetical protein
MVSSTIFNGSPGNPPPVPISITFLSASSTALRQLRESRKFSLIISSAEDEM